MERQGYTPVTMVMIVLLCVIELAVVTFAVGMFGDIFKG